MKKKIVLFGLSNYDNLGDPLLSECCEYLIKKNFNDVDICVANILPNNKNIIASFLKFILCVFGKINIRNPFIVDVVKYYTRKYMGKQHYMDAMKNAVAIIFVGGAYLKWKGEDFQYGIRNIIKYADRFNIPVMFNGIGVEGFSDSDIRCQKLTKAINSKCVKVITTRDDIGLLNEKFIYNKKIITDVVGDCALFLDELYNIDKSINKTEIGINVAYLHLFSSYRLNVCYSLEELLTQIVKKLLDRNIPFKFYCNGKIEDYNGGMQLIKNLGLAENLLCPKANSTLELINQINSFKCIIPLRLHSCIIAYALGIDFASYVWNPKMMLFAKVINREHDFQWLNQLNLDSLINTLESKIYKENIVIDDSTKKLLKAKTERYVVDFIKKYVYLQ